MSITAEDISPARIVFEHARVAWELSAGSLEQAVGALEGRHRSGGAPRSWRYPRSS